ncbi:hypothetical protein Skr01_19770 [Sphaerisporangium krabiense]|uniref:Putative Ser/Thr protein kinase n=1 Tax=Sphaerisporangium krabiense TaxID=763782 RepID=A0A7W8Z5A2_9ACTN|nr:serine/threonine-protein kinase [Sphaerisporangium krabiense]MBB5627734.1 putative Ser/Thr protein kinase [Sphaerisporangium krabiense]GII61892.1 hypothetical protein Skr01_19770 [Sphaerisporangium krabiense]
MSPPSPLLSGDPRELGRYAIAGRIGRGGQGTVYLGTSPEGARVAVKLMHSRLDDEKARRRFAGEVEAVRRVAPFCTAQVLDADLDDDRPYIVSEYVEGVSLQEHIRAEGPRTGGALDRIAVGTATALAAIHAAGVVHRDFKPGNVLLGADGPRVIDFGISRLMDMTVTTGRVPVGTPAYLSPEQLKGERAGPAADLFGWALTVAFAASGRHAYAADSYEAILGRILFGEADLDPLTGPLREVVVACLAESPARRPTAEEVLRRLIGRGADVLAAVPAPDERADAETAPTSPLPRQDLPSDASTSPRPRQDVHAAASTAPLPRHDVHAAVREAEPGHAGETGGRAGRRGPWWPGVIAGGTVLVTVAAAGAMWWSNARVPEAGVFPYTGRWVGDAEYPSAGRVFPVEMRLSGPSAPGRMLWGEDLHCTGRLTRTGHDATTVTYRLDQVRGEECYPGTVAVSPSAARRLTFRVTRAGETAPRYSGTAARAS